MRRIANLRVALLFAGVMILCGGSAYGAFVGLPLSGAQVNNDGSAIDPAQSVDRSDLTTGSLISGAARAPWATFDQPAAGGGPGQIFVRAFKNGAWQDEGFPESLNFSTSQSADSPSIDFTGPGRTVPWVSWAEPSSSLGATQIFASRFAPSAGQNGGQWAQEGQGRESVPSLNINTNRNADLPALTGGTTVAGGNPAPWITWQEFDGVHGPGTPTSGSPQVFVSHAVPATTGCEKPAGAGIAGHNFCFQQVGIDRVNGPGITQTDPSLNIDPTRSGIEGDIAFTGPNDTVPWVVWYENSDSNGGHASGLSLQNEDMVFAAKAVADASGDGNFHWQVVGLGTAGQTNLLDTSGVTHKFGPCAESVTAENACSLNIFASSNLAAGSGAENPSVTAGTMVAGSNTTPWISWDENSSNGGQHSVFVARLDKAGDHYDVLNNGQALSHSGFDSTRSDIVFVDNTPYLSWHETNGSGKTVTVVGHFEGSPANPVFHIDTPAAGIGTATSDVRSPIASTCPDDPFTGDGSACPGGSVGTPFYAFNAGTTLQSLFAQGYTPGAAQTGGASNISQTAATVAGSVNTDGAPARVHFEYGTSPAYGSTSAGQLLPPAAGTTTAVGAALGGLAPGTLIHYRVVAATDFGAVAGSDQTLTTVSRPLPPTISAASLTNKRFRVSRHYTAISAKKAPLGTTFRFTLSAAATLRITITRSAAGLRHGRSCVAPTTRLKRAHAKHCTRTFTLGTLTRASERKGADHIAFSGRLGHRALAPRAYNAILSASNAGGRSKPLRLSFVVVR
jgi:hypothetical protein